MLELIFWGVRGTNPVFGDEYKTVGGHTSCISLKIPGDPLIILDAGSGLHDLGKKLITEPQQIVNMLITHPHLDHLMGLPFFAPMWAGHCHINIYATHSKVESTIKDVLLSPPLFPVTLNHHGPRVYFHKLPYDKPSQLGQTQITHCDLNHPGGSNGFKLEAEGKVICYITDLEHDPGELDANLIAFVQGCDLLIYDASYTEEEYAHKRGWGHSTHIRAAEIAQAAGVKQLALFHQDPAHTDAVSARIELEAKEIFPNAFAAKQGMKLEI